MTNASAKIQRLVLDDLADETLLTVEETAEVLGGFSPLTLRQWRHLKKGPPYVRVGVTTVRYKAGHIRKYLAALETVDPAEQRMAAAQHTEKAEEAALFGA